MEHLIFCDIIYFNRTYKMEHIESEQQFLSQLLNLIAAEFGSKCEVVLHDLTKDYEHTIVDIKNGHITNRVKGGCGSNLGLEVLNGKVVDGDRFNYVTTTKEGKILRSSSMYIKNSKGEVIGSLCINLDITDSIHFESFLRQYNQFDMEATQQQPEYFAENIDSLIDYLIQQAIDRAGKNPKELTKEERLSFLTFLDEKGAMKVTKAGNKICDILGISKFTLYNDLETVRAKK